MVGPPSRDRGGEEAMWFTKRRQRSDVDALDTVDPVESLRRAAAEGGVEVARLRLSIPLGDGDTALSSPRNEIGVSDGEGQALWRVEALRPLFRGDRQPPPDVAIERYPPEYVLFFAGIEHSLLLFCALTRHPTEISMRRCGDARTGGAWDRCTT